MNIWLPEVIARALQDLGSGFKEMECPETSASHSSVTSVQASALSVLKVDRASPPQKVMKCWGKGKRETQVDIKDAWTKDIKQAGWRKAAEWRIHHLVLTCTRTAWSYFKPFSSTFRKLALSTSIPSPVHLPCPAQMCMKDLFRVMIGTHILPELKRLEQRLTWQKQEIK